MILSSTYPHADNNLRAAHSAAYAAGDALGNCWDAESQARNTAKVELLATLLNGMPREDTVEVLFSLIVAVQDSATRPRLGE